MHNGKTTMEEAAREVGEPLSDVRRHFVECIKQDDDSEFDEYMHIMKDLVISMNLRVAELEGLPTNLPNVKMVTGLVREIRGLIKDLAELEGRLQRSPMIQYNMVTMQYESLTKFLFEHLCDECKLSVGKQLAAADLQTHR